MLSCTARVPSTTAVWHGQGILQRVLAKYRTSKWSLLVKGVEEMGSDDTLGKVRDPIVAVVRWIKTRSVREKTIMGCLLGILVLLVMWRTIEDHDTLFILAEISHFVGIGVLVYKLQRKKSVAGVWNLAQPNRCTD
ncbi:uncharacterized protein HaLaN_08042 [Haematococcus lacustris]|uniref:Uncharacterized protein n=1 Tax=Haematococcus lacustris TaxID=44745 RepID=A0A699ZA10_HAELA|nr:uncharacterized protein HaLaN_08042 [Haematococcus lacustris]